VVVKPKLVLKPMYSVRELSVLVGVEPRRVLRWLHKENVDLVRIGRSIMVAQVDFACAFPKLWHKIRLTHDVVAA
jgi:hypothetical protein